MIKTKFDVLLKHQKSVLKEQKKEAKYWRREIYTLNQYYPIVGELSTKIDNEPFYLGEHSVYSLHDSFLNDDFMMQHGSEIYYDLENQISQIITQKHTELFGDHPYPEEAPPDPIPKYSKSQLRELVHTQQHQLEDLQTQLETLQHQQTAQAERIVDLEKRKKHKEEKEHADIIQDPHTTESPEKKEKELITQDQYKRHLCRHCIHSREMNPYRCIGQDCDKNCDFENKWVFDDENYTFEFTKQNITSDDLETQKCNYCKYAPREYNPYSSNIADSCFLLAGRCLSQNKWVFDDEHYIINEQFTPQKEVIDPKTFTTSSCKYCKHASKYRNPLNTENTKGCGTVGNCEHYHNWEFDDLHYQIGLSISTLPKTPITMTQFKYRPCFCCKHRSIDCFPDCKEECVNGQKWVFDTEQFYILP